MILGWAAFVASSALLAAEAEKIIETIRITGAHRIPEDTIRFYIHSREGEPFSEEKIRRDFRRLVDTNVFSSARVTKAHGEKGVILTFEVEERPLIGAIEYQGMQSVQASEVNQRFQEMGIGIAVNNPFDPAKLTQAREVVEGMLAESGRPISRVEPEVQYLNRFTVSLTFHVEEGPKVRIGNIAFAGNTVFSDEELRDSLELTKERSLISILTGQDKLVREKLEFDIRENLLTPYRRHGYLNAHTREPEIEIVEGPRGWIPGLRKTRLQHFITIPIEEGQQFRWGDFQLRGVEEFQEEEIRKVYRVSEGAVADLEAVRGANQAVKDLYWSRGYADVSIIPDLDADAVSGIARLTISIDEGKRYSVHRIRFDGNKLTRDKVLRREFVFDEQDLFNGELLEQSVSRLNRLGFFEPIRDQDYDLIKRPEHGEVDILVRVKELDPHSVNFGGGFSGLSGTFGGITFSTRNFRGLGQSLALELQLGTRTSRFRFAFTDPYFRDTDWALGFTVFHERLAFETFAAGLGPEDGDETVTLFDQRTSGFTVSADRPVTRRSRAGLGYSFLDIQIRDVNELFQDFAFGQLSGFTSFFGLGGGERLRRSQINPNFIYSTKDRPVGASRGVEFRADFPIAGGILEGTYSRIRPSLELQYFLSHPVLNGRRNTLALRAQASHVRPFGKLDSGAPMTVPFFERFFLGSEFDLRGFELRSISPLAIVQTVRRDTERNPIIDPVTGGPAISESLVPVGGDTSLIATAEYRIPVVGPLQVIPFFDVGTSTVLDKENLRIFGSEGATVRLVDRTNNLLRASTGLEFQLFVPVINQPLRLIFSYNPLVLRDAFQVGDKRRPVREPRSNFTFSIGYNF